MFGHSMFGVFEVQYFGVRSKTSLKFNLAEVGEVRNLGSSKFGIFVFVPALHLTFNFHIKILQMNRMIHPPFNVDQLFFQKM